MLQVQVCSSHFLSDQSLLQIHVRTKEQDNPRILSIENVVSVPARRIKELSSARVNCREEPENMITYSTTDRLYEGVNSQRKIAMYLLDGDGRKK